MQGLENSSPDAALRAFQTHDVDEQAALLRNWNQIYNQLSGGAFLGELWESEWGGLYLFRERTSASLHQVGELPSDRIAIGVPLHLPVSARFCGQVCDGSQVHVFSGKNGFEFHSPHSLDIVGLVIPESILHGVMLEDELDCLAPLMNNAHLMNTPREVRERLQLFLTNALETLTTTETAPRSPALGTAFAHDVARTLIEAFSTAGDQHGPSLTETRCWLIVQDAKQLARQAGSENLTVENICRSLNISRRTLQTCFQTALGIRPATYLRAVRLNAARRTLKECGCVTEAAAAWGFWHFGRFAQDYRLMFGEAPSQTLRRHASAAGSQGGENERDKLDAQARQWNYCRGQTSSP